MRGELPRARGRQLESHLAGCVTCQAAVAAVAAAGEAAGSALRWRAHRFAAPAEAAAVPPVSSAAADRRALLRGLGVAADAFGAGLLGELLAASEHRRRALVARDPRFASLPLAERLARACRAAWLDDPAAAVELARLGVAVASRLDAGLYGAAPVAAARALAWSHLGNSYRVASAWSGGPRGGSAAFEVAEAGSDAPPESGSAADGDYPLPRVEASSIGDAGRLGGPPLAAVRDALDDTLEAALTRRLPFEAALVVLDLVALDLAALELAAPELAPGGGALAALLAGAAARLAAAGLPAAGVERFQALAAAAAAGALDRALLAEAAAELGRARNDPAIRFGGEPER